MAKKRPAAKPAAKPTAKPATADASPPRFEESLGQLEKIVACLESGDLPLSEAIAEYEKGVNLLKQCHQALHQVQRKVELLTQVGEDGEPTTVPFDAAATPADRPARGKAADPADVDEGGRLF